MGVLGFEMTLVGDLLSLMVFDGEVTGVPVVVVGDETPPLGGSAFLVGEEKMWRCHLADADEDTAKHMTRRPTNIKRRTGMTGNCHPSSNKSCSSPSKKAALVWRSTTR